MARRVVSGFALSLLALGGCADNPTVPADAGPIQLTVVAAPTDFVACGAVIPVTATATKNGGRPFPNLLLNFNVLAGGGSMFGGAGFTNSKGSARDIWTIGNSPDRPNVFAVRAVDATTGVGTTYFTQTVTTLSKIAFTGGTAPHSDIYVMNADGSNLTNLTNDLGRDQNPDWSPNGSQIAFEKNPDLSWEIYVMDPDGSNSVNLTNSPLVWDRDPAWSPDGSRIAFMRREPPPGGNPEIYVMNADGSQPTNLTNNSLSDESPDWSSDGSKIVFERLLPPEFPQPGASDQTDIYAMNADGSNQANLTRNPYLDNEPAWSPDGSKIAFISYRDGNSEIYVMNADGSYPRRLTNDSYNEHDPAWSPDGSKIAFTTSRDGNYEIYVMNADGSNLTRLTNNTTDENFPDWLGKCAPR